jgi:hypothetical protein
MNLGICGRVRQRMAVLDRDEQSERDSNLSRHHVGVLVAEDRGVHQALDINYVVVLVIATRYSSPKTNGCRVMVTNSPALFWVCVVNIKRNYCAELFCC